MNITKRTKSEETTVYQFRVFLSQSADGKQRTRSKTWQPPAGMTAKAAEKEAKRQAVIFENEVKQGRAALDARTKLSDVAREYIEQTAQAILDARALYPDSSLADLYDELTMPPELRKAHQANDRAVMDAYGFIKGTAARTSESACVAELMKLYQQKISAAQSE